MRVLARRINANAATADLFCNNRKELYAHKTVHHQSEEAEQTFQTEPWKENGSNPPWEHDGDINDDLKYIYKQHRHLILKRRKTEGKVKNSYNFPVDDSISVEEMMEHIEQIYSESDFCFKINISLGIILQEITQGTYRYFVPYHNETLLSVPMYIRNRRGLDRLRLRLSQLDIGEYARRQRPNTKWKPVMLTNIVYHVYKTSYPLGQTNGLPKFIKKSKSIISFERNKKTGKIFSDNLCFFRCMAYHVTKKIVCERSKTKMYKQWVKYARDNGMRSHVVTLDRMPDLECCFSVNVNVFCLKQNKTVRPLYKSRETFLKENGKPDVMNLNIFENHLSYIKNLNSYCKKFECSLCNRLFNRKNKMFVHMKACEKAKHLKFPGGYFTPAKTIFESLKEVGICVESEHQNYPWILTWDMEAMLIDLGDEKSMWKAKHRPISVCMASNVPGFERTKFILESEEDNLLRQMINHMNMVSDKAYELSKMRWKFVFEEFKRLESQWSFSRDESSEEQEDNSDFTHSCLEVNTAEPPSEQFIAALSKANVYTKFLKRLQDDEFRVEYNEWGENEGTSETVENVSETSDIEQIAESGESGAANRNVREKMLRVISRLKSDFDLYCHRLIVLGFNSGKYDLNLIKTKLPKHLDLHIKSEKNFVIKKNNNYTCIATEKLKFLDMMNYLPPGTSYEKFLHTFDIQEKKSFFPYEYFTDISVLEETSLPPAEKFYSNLKQRNVLESDIFVKYCQLVEQEDKEVTEALHILGISRPPLSAIEHNYSELVKIWEQNNMSTMRDYLEFYNSLDVFPMLKAVEAYRNYFLGMNLDVFKDCVSIPGVARKMLFRQGLKAGASFGLLHQRDEDLYDKIKSCLIGGPSIVTTRYHEVGKTFIREDKSKPCSAIEGYDF